MIRQLARRGRAARARTLGALLIAALGGSLGCAFLLPRAHTSMASPWDSFEDALASYDRIEPGATTTADLAEFGFHPYRNPNVVLLDYMDVYERFASNDAVHDVIFEDEGLTRCIEARERCMGLRVTPWREDAEREGAWILDYLSFRKQERIEAWVFSSILVMVDDTVVYKLYDGSPLLLHKSDKVQPLGPIQEIDVKVKLSIPGPF